MRRTLPAGLTTEGRRRWVSCALLPFLLLAGGFRCALAYDLLTISNDAYDELMDRGNASVSFTATDERGLDCSAPPTFVRRGNQLDLYARRYQGVSGAISCAIPTLKVAAGVLDKGPVRVTAHVIDASGAEDAIVVERYVRPYAGSCNRYPRYGSIVNVWMAGADGSGIAATLRADPNLAALLGNPVVSLTLYRNSGAQLVYPTPEDPVPHNDAAHASGRFDNTVVNRYDGLFCAPLLGPDFRGQAVEYHHAAADSYFYTTDPGEAAGLDAFGSPWQRTGRAFPVIADSCDAHRQELYQAYRFVGPGTHVFTIDQEECYGVTRSPTWHFEGIGFYAMRPRSDGTCEDPQQRPLYRIWRPFGDPRHRFTVDVDVVRDMVAQGWIAEGAAMCVPLP